MSHTDEGSAARDVTDSPVCRTSGPPSSGRFRLSGLRGSASVLRRGGGALAGTALAAGLLAGGSPAAQAQQPWPLPPPAAPVTSPGEHLTMQHRMEGISRDLERAVAAGDVTQDQADAFFAKLARRIAP